MQVNNLNFNKNNIDHKILLICIIGAMFSYKNHCLSIDETEKFIFSPYVISILEKLECNKDILDLLEEGCELENIASILPDNLDNFIDDLCQRSLILLKNYEKYETTHWIEILS